MEIIKQLLLNIRCFNGSGPSKPSKTHLKVIFLKNKSPEGKLPTEEQGFSSKNYPKVLFFKNKKNGGKLPKEEKGLFYVVK